MFKRHGGMDYSPIDDKIMFFDNEVSESAILIQVGWFQQTADPQMLLHGATATRPNKYSNTYRGVSGEWLSIFNRLISNMVINLNSSLNSSTGRV